MKTIHKTNLIKKKLVNNGNGQLPKESLAEIFQELLRKIYQAEKYFIKALPKMAKASYNEELRKAFEDHLKDTKQQTGRIEECFSMIKIKAVAEKCEDIRRMIDEGDVAIANHDNGHTRDKALLTAAKKIEHYEISVYGKLRTMATALGTPQCAQLLEKCKDEEARAYVKLIDISSRINVTEEIKQEEVEQH